MEPVEFDLEEIMFIQWTMSYTIGSSIGVIADERTERHLDLMKRVSDKLIKSLLGE